MRGMKGMRGDVTENVRGVDLLRTEMRDSNAYVNAHVYVYHISPHGEATQATHHAVQLEN